MKKTPKEAVAYFDHVAENSRNWEVGSLTMGDLTDQYNSQPKGKLQLNETDDISARLALLTKKMEELEMKKIKAVNEVEVHCVVCEANSHRTEECSTLPTFKEVLYGQTSNS